MGPIVLRISLISAILFTTWAQNRPPAIITGPEKLAYISYTNQFMSTMACKTSGTPTPSVTWTRNLIPVNLNVPGTSVSSDGTLQMNPPEEGYYQCYALNTYGKVYSDVSWVRKLRLDLQQGSVTTTPSINVSVGDSLTLPCTIPPNSAIIPAATYKWQTVKDTTTVTSNDINFDRRVQIQDNGSLTFAYVVPADNQDNKFYRCQLSNTMSNDNQPSVAYTKVIVNPRQASPTQLMPLFKYSWPELALERNSVALRCFFGGAQDITVSWKKSDGTVINPTPGRYEIGISQLLIINVQKADEGDYICTGTSTTGLPSATATVNLRVESAPYFVSVNDGPHNVNVTNGDDVVINCNAYANPPASVVWFLNGEPFDSSNLHAKFKLSGDKKQLNISNVCKSCPQGTVANSDLMVIQCNTSNKHGYIYSNAYINVLDRTVITEPPSDVVLDYPNPVIFTCNATSDVATVVSYSWTLNGQAMYDGSVNQSIPGVLYIDVANDQKKGEDFKGEWICNATNGVSSAHQSAFLKGPPGAVSGASVWPLWWIPFIVLLILLIFILLLLLICWCCYRNRGDAYPVDEEERKGGNDPVKELHEIGFHDFQRPVDAPDGVILNTPLERARRGPGSISSSIGKGVSDDEMSLDNYSNINHGKFTEDGSFIGQYNPNRRKIQMMQPGIPESMA